MSDALNKLTLEKLEIHQRLLMIEEYIKEGKEQRSQINETMNNINLRCINVELMIHGDAHGKTKLERDGLNRRTEKLEDNDLSNKTTKENLLKVAIGAITLAVGSFLLWVFRIIFSSIGK